MMKKIDRLVCIVLCLVLTGVVQTALASADDDTQKYFYGKVEATDTSKGYSNPRTIPYGDPHFGKTVGKFSVSGFAQWCKGKDGGLVFLKTVGDGMKLSFLLDQDIDRLFGNEDMRIGEDKNGYNERLGVTKQDTGRGMLIVRHSDFRNDRVPDQIYTDYLADISKGTGSDIEILEEGKYEVELDYRISKDGWPWGKEYDYRISFNFSVINGNAMVYSFDAGTDAELYNGARTSRGFRLDFGESHYLEVTVQRELASTDGNDWDIRFNRPARDGERFSDEGRYTINVRNTYTDAETVKVITVEATDPERTMQDEHVPEQTVSPEADEKISEQGIWNDLEATESEQTVSPEANEKIPEQGIWNDLEAMVPEQEMPLFEVYYDCPNCGAILDMQYGFSPELDYWICAQCGMYLIDGDNEDIYQGELYEDVLWFCDGCETFLNKQPGFNDRDGAWKCTECGYDNEISEENIRQ